MAGLRSAAWQAQTAVELPMAWVGFQPFTGPITGYGTQNLRSCSVVLVDLAICCNHGASTGTR